jgi:CarboxypepD_reg-like domain/TonB-dependent Receptor Plug Domain
LQNNFLKIHQIVLISILFLSQFSNGQQFGKLRGVVTDSTNGEALAYCNVYVQQLNSGASTNERGLFIINSIPANKKYTIVVSYVGYDTRILSVQILPDKVNDIEIKLLPLSIELQTVEKIGEKIVQKNSTDIGLERISIRQIENLPKGVETDVMRSLQYLPGVKSTGDVSAKYYVRGGTGDQNLVLLNGITIYNPFHSLGILSVVDPEMINSVDFYKGSFTSEFGSRISSVLNVVSKDGNKNRFGGKVSASFLTAKGLIEGPIPNGSFLISGRKSISEIVLKKFLNDQTVPIDFYDYSFKVNYSSHDLWHNAKFVLFGFFSVDKLDYDDPARENINWKSNLIGFEWLQIYDIPVYSRIAVSLSQFDGEVIPNLSSIKPTKNVIDDFNVSVDFNIVSDNKDELGLGLNLKVLDTQLRTENQTGAITDLSRFAGNFTLYGKYKLLRYEHFGLDAGTRVNISGLTRGGSFFPEPRISLNYRILPFASFKAAWGIYLQEVATVTDEDEVISVFEPWIIIPKYLEPTKGIQYTAGVNIDVNAALSIGVEGYYKISKNLPIVNQKKYYDFEDDLVSGTGESYGWEFLLKYSQSPFSFAGSYALSWAYKEVDDYLYYPKYDSRHALNLSFEYLLGSGWISSVIWSYSSGIPFTQLMGYYDKIYLTNIFDPWYQSGNFNPYLILGDQNLGRLPSYHRLDFSVSKITQLFSLRTEIDFSIINAYNRENIFYFDRDNGEQVNMLPFLFTATIKIEI